MELVNLNYLHMFADYQGWRGTCRSQWGGQVVQHPRGLRWYSWEGNKLHLDSELWQPLPRSVTWWIQNMRINVNYVMSLKYFHIWNLYLLHLLCCFFICVSIREKSLSHLLPPNLCDCISAFHPQQAENVDHGLSHPLCDQSSLSSEKLQ